jgi:hypothetical protein
VSHLAMLRMFDQHWGRVKSAEGQVAEIEAAQTDQESTTLTFPCADHCAWSNQKGAIVARSKRASNCR